MKNLSENEREKILDRISQIKEDIWEAREYINSDYCKKCSEIYSEIVRLEQQLEDLQRKLEKYERG
jgi:chromosome segregation ATPase